MDEVLKFFASERSIASALSKQPELLSKLRARYGESVESVGDYFALTQGKVYICDVSSYIGRST